MLRTSRGPSLGGLPDDLVERGCETELTEPAKTVEGVLVEYVVFA
jgi:hypothetical protein